MNEDDPVKAQLVDDRISALITEANLLLSQRISEQAAGYIDLLIEGGTLQPCRSSATRSRSSASRARATS